MVRSKKEANAEAASSERVSVRLTPQVKAISNAIQQCGGYTFNGILNHMIDLHIKYHGDEVVDKITAFLRATVQDDEMLNDCLSHIKEYELTEVMRSNDILKQLNDLKQEVNVLRNELRTLEQSTGKRTLERTLERTLGQCADIPTANIPSKANTKSNISTNESRYASHSLNSLIEAKLKNTAPSWFKDFTYNNFVFNFSELAHTQDLKPLQDEIDSYVKELMKLLQSHCDNIEMCNAFKPVNMDVFTRYIDVRLTKSGERSDITDIWNLTLSEIEETIIGLGQYEATDTFVVTSATINSPQSAMKTVLRNQYGMIFKEASTFKTF